MNASTLLFTVIILVFGLFSWRYIQRYKENPGKVNLNFLESIPGIFTTLGILGTFVGIFIALIQFNVHDISGSIPRLLDGLKTAFLSSILGIIASLLFSRVIEFIQPDKETAKEFTDEFSILKSLHEQFTEYHKAQTGLMQQLIKSVSGDTDDSLATQIVKMRTSLVDGFSDQKQILDNIQSNLGSDDETSLLTQISKMRLEQADYAREMADNLKSIKSSLEETREFIGKKFEEFGELLEKSNTEALVKAIENVIGGFNERLNELIERLVKENFEELNQSVQRLNEWQQENKEQVAALINQFKQVSEELGITSENLEKISGYTKELVDGEGKLKDLITELEEVLTKNTMLRESAEHLLTSSENLEKSAVTLQNWMELEKDLGESIEKLIDNLKEIEKLRDKTGEFWTDIREKMEEGINILEQGNKDLMKKIAAMDEAFYDRLNTSFRNLDTVLQNMVMEYAERLNKVLNVN